MKVGVFSVAPLCVCKRWLLLMGLIFLNCNLTFNAAAASRRFDPIGT